MGIYFYFINFLMPTEGHAFMFGGTKKRCTLVEEKVI